MATINVNGKIYKGNNVSIIGNNVVIDGKVQDKGLSGVVEVKILEGVLENLSSDASVSCNNVHGNVSAGGSVSCDDIGGNVNAGGSVSCDDIGGNVNAGGSIKYGNK